MAMVQPTDAVLDAQFPPAGMGIEVSAWSGASRDERAAMIMGQTRPDTRAQGAAAAPEPVEMEAKKPVADVQAPPNYEARFEKLLASSGGRGTPFT
jgi:hypothetical protein|tara:strand:+ start:585 stop:872 length:288 start_codon:yes stop_codon:yes gene_type:complete